jgi:hypothetical protein
MAYYLVKATVEKNEYQGETTKEKDVRLVKARSEEDAWNKYMTYWERRSYDYGTLYIAYGVEVLETID